MDLWQTVLLPALTGDRQRVHLTIERISRHLPPKARSRGDAIAARALFAVGDISAAMRRLRSALEQNDPEARALARLMLPDGIQRAGQAMLNDAPGAAADAGCDRVWLHLRRGELTRARQILTATLSINPDHLESLRWWQVFNESGKRLCRWVQDPKQAPDPMQTDLMALMPTERQGWLSWERLSRRPWGHTQMTKEPVSGLDRLIQAGVWSRSLASDPMYAKQSMSSMLVEVEWALARARSLRRGGRTAGGMLAVAWKRALQLPEEATQRAAIVIVELALSDPSASRVGRMAAEALSAAIPCCPRWPAAEARLMAEERHEGAVERARSVLVRDDLDATSWRLAVDALRRSGCIDEAAREARRALRRPVLRPGARDLLSPMRDR